MQADEDNIFMKMAWVFMGLACVCIGFVMAGPAVYSLLKGRDIEEISDYVGGIGSLADKKKQKTTPAEKEPIDAEFFIKKTREGVN